MRFQDKRGNDGLRNFADSDASGDMTISMVRQPEKTYNRLQDLANKATR